DDAPRTDAGKWRPSRVQEQDAATLAAIQIGPHAFDVHRDFADGAAADGHKPFLAAFSEYARDALLEKQILQLHTDELRDAHAGGIRELQQRVIANGQRLIGIGRLEELLHLLDTQHGRQRAPALGRLDPLARVPREESLADQEFEIGPDRRDLSSNSGRGKTDVLEKVDEVTQLFRRQLARRFGAPAPRIFCKSPDVAEIVIDGVAAVAGLERQVVAKALELEGLR